MRSFLLAAALALGLTSGALAQMAGVSGHQNVTPIAANSSDVAANTATATLTPAANQLAFVCGYVISGAGATSASTVSVTITNLVGGTLSFDFPVPAGATVNLGMIPVQFYPCLPAAAINTAIAVSAPSLGTGNLHARMTAWGYLQNE